MIKPSWVHLIVPLLLSTACMNYQAAVSTVPDEPRVGPPVRDVLASDEAEDDGYGFYSYLVMRRTRNAEVLERYRSVLDAFLSVTPATVSKRTRAHANMTYVFVMTRAPESVRELLPGCPSDDPRRRAAVDWLLANYDYDRAEDLMKAVHATHGGPYIVQSPSALAPEALGSSPILLQDLSALSSQYVDDLFAQVLKESDARSSWRDDQLQRWYIRVCDLWHEIGITAKQVTELVTWVPVTELAGNGSHSR